MKKNLITFMFLLFATIAVAQVEFLPSQKDVTKHTEKVMSYFAKLDLPHTFSELKKHWPLPPEEIMELEATTTEQFEIVLSRFGKAKGYEFIEEKVINNTLIKRVYIIKFEKHMLRVQFTYYNNGDGWVLNMFKWDDSISELFD